MKTVFDNAMVAHVWAQQSQSQGRSHNGQLFFRDSTIFSYGEHFPIARFVRHGERQAVLFTTLKYSVTTARHKGLVARAIPPTFAVFNVCAPLSADHAANEADYRDQAAKLHRAVCRADQKTWKARTLLASLEDTIRGANAYAEFFGLAWRLDAPSLDPAVIERVRAEAKAESKAKAELTRAKNEELKKIVAKQIQEWREGKSYFPAGHSDICLRLSSDGTHIQTSRGAEFPVEHGKRAFALIAKLREQGRDYKPGNALALPMPKLGHFAISHVYASGGVRAGCHYVKWQEIEALARKLELLP